MPAAIEARFRQALQQVSDVRRWVIGHSGGLDSQVLLELAHRFLPPDAVRVIHVNHHLQQSSDQWAAFSASQAAQRNLSHLTLDVTPASRSENSARDARYATFTEQLQEGDCLLLAHHADDQAETLLFRLLRGAALRGLSGMPAVRPLGAGKLCRPLLICTRSELEQYALHASLEWVDDPSNRSADYDRNYLRLKVLPALAVRWPGFQQRWVKAAAQLRQTEQVLNDYLDRDLDQMAGARFELPVTPLLALPAERRYHLLRRWYERATGVLLGDDRLTAIDAQVLNAREDASPCFELGGYALRRYRGALYLARNNLSRRESVTTLNIGELTLSDGVLTVEPGARGLATLEGARLVRRSGGERCRPVGRGGSCSLKKLLQEAGIPPWLRQDWPLVLIDETVVAVPGICICEGWQSESGGFTLSWRSFALSDGG